MRGSPVDIHAGWAAYTAAIDDVEAACRAGDAPAAHDALERARVRWLDTHDRGCDLVYGMLDLVVRHLGERRMAARGAMGMAPRSVTIQSSGSSCGARGRPCMSCPV